MAWNIAFGGPRYGALNKSILSSNLNNYFLGYNM